MQEIGKKIQRNDCNVQHPEKTSDLDQGESIMKEQAVEKFSHIIGVLH
jgi:hypothetical protein